MPSNLSKRGRQSEYNKLLDTFDAVYRSFAECVDYLISLGFSENQANNAVHVYRKGGPFVAKFRLSQDQRNELLDNFNATSKTPKDCVNYLRSKGCTYRQANSAVYKYRQEKGLIST